MLGSLGTTAERLDCHFDEYNGDLLFTSTPYVEESKLNKFVEENLSLLEQNNSLSTSTLNELSQLVSMIPPAAPQKEEYLFRIKSLKTLYTIYGEISVNNIEHSGDLSSLMALLKTTSAGPLRNFLENEINKIHTDEPLEEKDKMLHLSLNRSVSPEEIDEILCEMSIEEYINVGKMSRDIISKQFFKARKKYSDEESVLKDLRLLINKIDKSKVEEPPGNNPENSITNTISIDKGNFIKILN